MPVLTFEHLLVPNSQILFSPILWTERTYWVPTLHLNLQPRLQPRQMTPCHSRDILVKDGVINEQSCDSLLKTFFKKSASIKNILKYSIVNKNCI
jgi:hypothetical protein